MTQDRLGALARSLEERGLQAFALVPGPSFFYFTGLSFHLLERPIVGIFSPASPPCLVVPELERPKVEASGLNAVLFAYQEDDISRGKAFAAAATHLRLDSRRVGVEPMRMRFLELRHLEEAAPRAEFLPADDAISPLRIVKDEVEIASTLRAVQMAEIALTATLPLVKVGMSERELASELTLQLLRSGSDPEIAFNPIVASGPNTAQPHAVPGGRRIGPRDLLILDWGARWQGYVSDLTRTFAVSEPDPTIAPAYDAVMGANAAAREAVHPDATCGEVDHAARSVIQNAGYAHYFIHRAGHGIGLESHEPPYIRDGSEERLSPGMIFTIEPGIYLPGKGGIRIEDNVLVTERGQRTLSEFGRELRVVA